MAVKKKTKRKSSAPGKGKTGKKSATRKGRVTRGGPTRPPQKTR